LLTISCTSWVRVRRLHLLLATRIRRSRVLVEALTERGFEVTTDRRDLPFGEKWQAFSPTARSPTPNAGRTFDRRKRRSRGKRCSTYCSRVAKQPREGKG
jgi:hypothetical protein